MSRSVFLRDVMCDVLYSQRVHRKRRQRQWKQQQWVPFFVFADVDEQRTDEQSD